MNGMEINIEEVLKAFREMVAEQAQQIVVLKAQIATLNKQLEAPKESDSGKSE